MQRWTLSLLGLATLATAQAAPLTGGEFRELGGVPAGGVAWEREVDLGGRMIKISGVSFDERKATFRVLDNPPAARQTLEALLVANGAFAGANASYFHADFRPLGLVVSDGETLHGFEKAKLLSGVLAVRKGGIQLVRSGAFKPGPDVREAIQCGPWLVEEGAPVAGLEDTRLHRRTAVATDGKSQWAIITTGAVTMADAARILSLKDLPGAWSIVDALNLDGGGSTSLLALGGGQKFFDIRSFGPVRNYLAIVPRQR